MPPSDYEQGMLKGGTVPLTSCLTGLDESLFANKNKIVTCRTADSKPIKQEVNGTVIFPPLVLPGVSKLEWLSGPTC